MSDSETDLEADASRAALMAAELTALRELLVERDELIRDLRDEIRLLKNLPRRPDLKPSGLAASARGARRRRHPAPTARRRAARPAGRVAVHGAGVRKCAGAKRRWFSTPCPRAPERKGYQAHTVRDVVFYAEEVTWLREVWRFPDGSRHVAPLPPGAATGRGQYGPEVKALAIMLYYQCQSTVDRIVAFLNDMGLDISKRQVGRFLNEDTGVVVEEQQDVLRIGMETAAWINVDDTGARHPMAFG